MPGFGDKLGPAVPAKRDSNGDEKDRIQSGLPHSSADVRTKLEDLNTPGSWNHLTEQIGMFSYTGLNKNQIKHLIEKFHVYLPDDGRISLAGLNTGNVQYVAEAINDAVVNVQ